jgi:hypothetical protein
MITRLPSYVVAEIPEPTRSEIQALRDSFSTPTALLPVEITLLGSSGTGPIPVGTSISFIQEQIDSLLSTVSSWEVSFSEIRIFPNTSIVYLAPTDRQPFDHCHKILRYSSLPTLPSKFSYNPHCTLRSGPATTLELASALERKFPQASFMIEMISVYSAHCDLVYQKSIKA